MHACLHVCMGLHLIDACCIELDCADRHCSEFVVTVIAAHPADDPDRHEDGPSGEQNRERNPGSEG